MFFKRKNNQAISKQKTLLLSYAELIQSYPLAHKDFLLSFEAFCKLLQIKNASLYFFEDKAKLFLLKKWIGMKPARFAISENYELIKYLISKKTTLIKRDFAESAHDLRQPALFFFQQTSSTHVWPISGGYHFQGLLMLDLSEQTLEQEVGAKDLTALYVHEIANWCHFQALSVSHQKLSEIAHVKNQLLANVSHELQTPLNGILGLTEVIIDGADGDVSAPLLEHIKMIRESGENLHKTISNFLQLAQIEARKSEIKHEKSNICELLSEVTSLFQESLQKRDIHLKLPDLQKPIYVFVEPDQIRTVLMNLLSNAAKFTPKGAVTVSLKKSVEMLHVSVADTGIGVDADKLDLIFEEFYQGDGSHTRVYGGTGLGLAIAKKIIALHGGRIWAAANGNQGTNFTFTVPLCPGV